MKRQDQASSQYAAIARAYFAHKRVFRYRMKKISDMSDEEVVQKCHWWQEEHHMTEDYWAFVSKHETQLGQAETL